MKKALLLSALFSVAAAANAVELVTNGNFESGVAPWSESGTFPLIGANGEGGPIVGNSAWLGGYDDANDLLTQSISSTGYGSATLTFDAYLTSNDVPTWDFFTISYGGNVLDVIDLGLLDDFYSFSYDLTPYLNGGSQLLSFGVTTDDFEGSYSSAILDNVSINAQAVPEPASMAALGLGGLALLRRRRKNA